MQLSRLLTLVALPVLVLAACGGDRAETNDADASAEAPSTARAEAPAASRSQPEARTMPTETDSTGGAYEYTNRLIHEQSPYLQQHAHNPVDWYPWGEEALARARAEDKPIFLSIGYSTCHWCHVMEHETFENPEIAAYLNEHFIPIKVDREERPDLDNLYMAAVQAMTGRGGWPMSVFLTPDLKPFFGGTYFPPYDRGQMPGFSTLTHKIAEAWATQRQELLASSDRVGDFLLKQATQGTGAASAPLDTTFLADAYHALAGSFDASLGGFGGAPKFPTPHRLTFLLRRVHRTGDPKALAMVRKTLDAMACGGMYDHVGGGFHRYSTDARWFAPHFEKMLYDQAGLAEAYTQGWLVTGDPNDEAVARGILDYVLDYMHHPEGGFYSAEDADSEGEEGKFYVWTAGAIDSVLGTRDGAAFRAAYGVTAEGNWEGGANILHTQTLDLIRDPAMIEARRKLLAVRDRRIRPRRDDKIVTAWNGYMIEAMAQAGWAMNEPRYTEAAERAAAFLHQNLEHDGRLLRHYRGTASPVLGYLDDYAYLGRAYLTLYETTFKPKYLERAVRLTKEMVRLFERTDGGFVFAGHDAEALLAPVVEVYDGAMPSGNSVAASLLLRLGHLTADGAMEDLGWKTIKSFGAQLERSPSNFMEMISALDFGLGPDTEVVLAGDPTEAGIPAMIEVLRGAYRPNTVIALRPNTGGEKILRLIPYLKDQPAIDGKPTAYVCRSYACKLPVHDAGALQEQLRP